MHKFLRSIGFTTCQKRKQLELLLNTLQQNASRRKFLQLDPETTLCELRTEFAPGMGVVQVGTVNEYDAFEPEYYYPYMLSGDMSSAADCSLQRHTDKETFAGLMDESRVGISLIFFVENSFEYRERLENRQPCDVRAANLTAMCTDGRILLPISGSGRRSGLGRSSASAHNRLVEAAKNGDQDAIETLTIEDIDLYSRISRRIQHEDVYSIVESTFMPSGIECDQYSILGEIFRVDEKINVLSGEKVYDLTLECNEMILHVCIAAADLLGEPAPGRRFKGQVWLQGTALFTDRNRGPQLSAGT